MLEVAVETNVGATVAGAKMGGPPLLPPNCTPWNWGTEDDGTTTLITEQVGVGACVTIPTSVRDGWVVALPPLAAPAVDTILKNRVQLSDEIILQPARLAHGVEELNWAKSMSKNCS